MNPESKDWTRGSDGRSNSSELFYSVIKTVEDILNGHRIGDSAEYTSRLIVAALAHRRGFGPVGEDEIEL